MTALFVIRPEPGNGTTVAAARGLGLNAQGTPLFEVSPRDWNRPDGHFDALLIGSANALRHGGPRLAELRHLPVYAVGEATAGVARNSGFTVAAIGQRGLQDLLDRLDPGHRRLLRLAGAERVALSPPSGVELVERVVYASEPIALPEALADALRGGGIVLLHSAAAARHFAFACERLAIPRAALSLACIGPRVAEAAESGWADVQSAPEPTDCALLALARGMCQ
jgi:uroporphyrinogen-III synthase